MEKRCLECGSVYETPLCDSCGSGAWAKLTKQGLPKAIRWIEALVLVVLIGTIFWLLTCGSR